MKEANVSVIIPVYNSEAFLASCIESVTAQTFDKLEILIVDDGSEDGSRKICRKHCKKDGRIQLIEQTHKGVSAARNLGIEKAEGEYLFFLDSDDMIHPQLIEALYILLENTGADIASESYLFADGDSKDLAPEDWKMGDICQVRSRYLNNEKAINRFILGDREAVLNSIGGKMCRRKALGFQLFDEELTNGEDTLFLYLLLAKGADVVVLQCNWYCYRKHSKGANHRFSVAACQSRYKAERYICDSEIESKRMENAKYRENDLLAAMIFWLKEGLNNNDKVLIEYVKEKSEYEKGLDIFSQIRSEEKERFCSIFASHPFYIRMRLQIFWNSWAIRHPRIRRWVWMIRQKARKKTGKQESGK